MTFVDRDRELEALATLLGAAPGGVGGLAVVGGEPGAGKTRLLAQASGAAAGRGALVGWGAFAPGASALYGWRQAMRAIAPGFSLAPVDGDGPAPRFTGHEAVVEALADAGAAGGGRPSRAVVVVLDDLQWADPTSIELCRFVARLGRPAGISLLLAHRTTDPGVEERLAPLLADLAGLGLHLPLDGLTPAGIARLAGGDLTDEEATVLHRRTGGNAFFVVESLRLRRAGHADVASPGVDAVVATRLDQVAPATRSVLEAAALLGGDLDTGLVAEVLELDARGVGEAIVEAARAGLLVRRSLGTAGHRFAHDIVREHLVDRLPAARRADLSRRAGTVLAARAQPGDEHRTAELLAAGLGPDEPAIVVAASHRAAAAARAQHVPARVAHHLGRARELGDDTPGVALDLADALLLSGRADEAQQLFAEVAHRARSEGDLDVLVRAALGIGGGPTGFEVPVGDPSQVEVLDLALQAVGTGPTTARALLLARRSLAAAYLDPPHARIRDARDALAIATEVADDRATGAALASLCDACAGPDHVADRSAWSAQLVEAAQRAADNELELLGHRACVVAALERGDLETADRHIADFASLHARRRDPRVGWYVPLWRGMRSLLRGDTDAALTGAEQADELADLGGSQNGRVLALSLRGAALDARGEAAELAREVIPSLEAMRDAGSPLPSVHAALCQLAVMTDDHALARRALDDLAAIDFGAGERDAEFLGTLTYASRGVVFVGDAVQARRLRELLAPYGGRLVVDGIGAVVEDAVDAVLAQLAAFLGDGVEAERHRQLAVELAIGIGAPRLEARFRAIGSSSSDHPAVEPQAVSARTGAFRRMGAVWELSWAGRTVTVADAKGLHDLAVLIRHAGREVHVHDLAGAGVEARPVEVLDGPARRAYANRLAELDDDIRAATEAADLALLERLTDEREWLVAELRAAVGVGGRTRTMVDDRERARQAVGARVRWVLKRLDQLHPELARHLRHGLRLGTWCSYTPEEPVTWDLR